MEHLLEIQALVLTDRALSRDQEARVQELRTQVPEPILAHFDRLIVRGKKGVAIARNGACGECHLRLPSGTLAQLAKADDVHLCENCDRYLYLPPAPSPESTPPPVPIVPLAKSPAQRGRRKASASAA